MAGEAPPGPDPGILMNRYSPGTQIRHQERKILPGLAPLAELVGGVYFVVAGGRRDGDFAFIVRLRGDFIERSVHPVNQLGELGGPRWHYF